MADQYQVIESLANILQERPAALALTGAGCSTESGLGDYRDRSGNWKRDQPITGSIFKKNTSARKRYWARSSIGWPAFRSARPARSHQALAEIERLGLLTHLITQNVDGLHQHAGHRNVMELHGNLATVSCVDCSSTVSRDEFQHDLLSLNPALATLSAESAPDGDADLDADSFDWLEIPDCLQCTGLMKPDVVFFGENVPKELVSQAMELLEGSGALLIAGSSLMVYSGFRFCKKAKELGLPIIIINRGVTRADDLATLKIEQDTGESLMHLAQRLVMQVHPSGSGPVR